MTIPFRRYSELIKLLSDNGWLVIADGDWESHNRVMIGKDGVSFPLQIQEVYYYKAVVKLCRSLDIESPEDCLTCYNQEKGIK